MFSWSITHIARQKLLRFISFCDPGHTPQGRNCYVSLFSCFTTDIDGPRQTLQGTNCYVSSFSCFTAHRWSRQIFQGRNCYVSSFSCFSTHIDGPQQTLQGRNCNVSSFSWFTTNIATQKLLRFIVFMLHDTLVVHNKHCNVEIATIHCFHASRHISMVHDKHCKVEIAMFHGFHGSRQTLQGRNCYVS